jgi:small subunit ribosomal protein S6
MSTVRQYELVYITPPETTEETLADLHQQVAAVVERFGGTIEKTENWGRRRLAYEIAGHREGAYVFELINGPGALTAELDRRLRVVDTVVRHMIVRVDEDLAAADRARDRRKAATTARRVRRGLPPEPTESERQRRADDEDDGDGGMDHGFRDRGDR